MSYNEASLKIKISQIQEKMGGMEYLGVEWEEAWKELEKLYEEEAQLEIERALSVLDVVGNACDCGELRDYITALHEEARHYSV